MNDDWPQETPPPFTPPDDETLTFDEWIAWAVPPPEVWEFYRQHGRWPEAGEA